jgi:molybdate transport system substrate-binding protein
VGRACADTLSIAAASDLVFCLERINALFKQQYPQVDIKVTTGSSGVFFSQIQQDAPFDVYLSADIRYPQKLIIEKKADANTLSMYAIGQIALWTNKPTVDVAQGLAVLSQPNIKRIAIANPDHAPYGQAARAVLVKQQLWDKISPKLVTGENIAQTLQFVQTLNADVGFVALSLLRAPQLAQQGRYWLIPNELYPPLEQAMVVTKRGQKNPWAYRYTQFLKSVTAQRVFSDYGFLLPTKSL